jgi:hypothetical protein
MEEAVIALCERKLGEFLRDFLAKQPNVRAGIGDPDPHPGTLAPVVADRLCPDPVVAGAVRSLHAAGRDQRLPGVLLERFAGQTAEPLLRLLLFLTPLTVRSLIAVVEGR